MLSRTKGLVFVLKSFTEYNIVVDSLSAFVFKIIRPVIFSAYKKKSFPQSRKFPTMKNFFLSHGNFPQLRNFSANKDHKSSLKPEILDSFNTESLCQNIFNPLTLMLYSILTECNHQFKQIRT